MSDMSLQEAIHYFQTITAFADDRDRKACEIAILAIAAIEAELATKTCNKQVVSKLEDAELARDSEETCNNKQVLSKLVASEDVISRQAAIDTIESWLSCDDYNEAERHIMKAMKSVLYDLPSVTVMNTSFARIVERGWG